MLRKTFPSEHALLVPHGRDVQNALRRLRRRVYRDEHNDLLKPASTPARKCGRAHAGGKSEPSGDAKTCKGQNRKRMPNRSDACARWEPVPVGRTARDARAKSKTGLFVTARGSDWCRLRHLWRNSTDDMCRYATHVAKYTLPASFTEFSDQISGGDGRFRRPF
jgi:hypothetical protein